MQKLLEGLHAVHTSRYQYDTLIVSYYFTFLSRGTKIVSNWPPIGLLRRWAPSPAYGYTSSCSSHASCHWSKVSQCQHCLLQWFCWVEKGRVRCSPSIPDSAYPQFGWPLCQMEMATREYCHVGQRKSSGPLKTICSILTTVKRSSLHRIIPGNYNTGVRRGIRTTVFGEKRESYPSRSRGNYLTEAAFYDPKSEGRVQREERLLAESKKWFGIRGSVATKHRVVLHSFDLERLR